MAEGFVLGPRDVHVWLLPIGVGADAVLRAGEALLPDDEREALDRLVVGEVRALRMAGRVLRRVVLSKYAAVPPEAWRFQTAPGGRPEIAGPGDLPPLRFSVTHTAGLVACAVALGRAIGLDAEAVDRRVDVDRLAARVFAPEERAALRALDEAGRRLAFFRHWTAKEAYLKARGLGLRVPLAAVRVHLAATPPSLTFGPPITDDPAAWQLEFDQPTARHVLAVVVRRDPDRDLVVAWHWASV